MEGGSHDGPAQGAEAQDSEEDSHTDSYAHWDAGASVGGGAPVQMCWSLSSVNSMGHDSQIG